MIILFKIIISNNNSHLYDLIFKKYDFIIIVLIAAGKENRIECLVYLLNANEKENLVYEKQKNYFQRNAGDELRYQLCGSGCGIAFKS